MPPLTPPQTQASAPRPQPPKNRPTGPKAPVELSPEYHTIMLRHGLSSLTVKALTTLPRAAEPPEILRCVSSATEFRTFTFRPAERGTFSDINNDPQTPWPITKESLSQPWQKVYLVALCEASGGDYGGKLTKAARMELFSARTRILKGLGNVLRACVDIMGVKKDAAGLRRALEILRAVTSGSWEGRSTELLQVPDVGPKKVQTLVERGVTTVRQLAQLEFFHIERLLSRNPPYGQNMVRSLSHFPRLVLAVDIPKLPPGTPNLVVRALLACSNAEVPVWKKKTPRVTLAAETPDGRLVFWWRGSVESLMSGKELVFPVEAAPGQTVFVWASCEEIAGTVVTKEATI